MSYTNETTYYGLPLPTGSDKSTFTDNNTAFQAVDAALHTAYEQSGAAAEDIVAIKATVANLIQADIDFQSDLNTEKGKIRNLQDKEVLQDAAIAAVEADAFDMITAYNEPTATSTHAYSAGDFFIYNDVLYRATETIALGDTIVPDTNCTTTNVSTELLNIKAHATPTKGVYDVSVTCDGVKTNQELLLALNALIDYTKFSSKSKLIFQYNLENTPEDVYSISEFGVDYFRAGAVQILPSSTMLQGMQCNPNGTTVSRNIEISSVGAVTVTDTSSTVPAAGSKFGIIY